MKKVMLYAYAGSNLGDDLFIKMICERYPKTKFVLYAPERYKKTFKHTNNLTIVPKTAYIIRGANFLLRMINSKRTIRDFVARRCDLNVNIGGSIFMQRSDWKKQTMNKEIMLNNNKKPFFLLGANFGPYEDTDFYLANRNIIKKYTDISFRDEYSFQLFSDLDNVRIADDIVFQLDNNNSKQQNNQIVISVIQPSFREDLINYDQIYYEKIKEIALEFIKKDYEITFISFCKNEGDEEAIEEIMSMIPKNYLNKVNKHFYQTNLNETLDVIKKARFMVATRFHAMILGWVYSKPVFPIAYSKKMTNVMKDINFEGNYTDFENLDKLEPKQVFKSLESNIIDVSEQAINAEQHFKKLDEYLKVK